MKFLIICLLATLNFCAFVNSVKLVCEFKSSISNGYACFVKELEITSKSDRVITEVTGVHLNSKTDDDVVYFQSQQHVIKYFPLNLDFFFKNLNNVYINGSSMVEVNAEDLQQFGSNFIGFVIQNSNLEVLEAGLFATMPNLKTVSFHGNNIRNVDGGVFTNLKQLNKIWFGSNSCYSGKSIEGNATAAMEISIEIEKKCNNSSQVAQSYQNDLRDIRSMLEVIMAKVNKLESERRP